jgi:hypothetical protein
MSYRKTVLAQYGFPCLLGIAPGADLYNELRPAQEFSGRSSGLQFLERNENLNIIHAGILLQTPAPPFFDSPAA